jgi:DNA polymerase-3 subunit delta'
MRFADVIGQQEVKDVLLAQVRAGRLPHALLLTGDTGYGTLALALALASYVMCSQQGDSDSCGECSECIKTGKLVHPDLHFSFPVIKKSSGTTTSDTYLKEWLTQLTSEKYFDLTDWLRTIGTENKQAIIPDDEADNIIRKLSLSAYEGGWKVMVIWLPEKMNGSAANTLLKMLEEPSPKTLFILCSEHPEQLLDTIVSRTQRIDVPPLSVEDLTKALMERRGLDRDTAVSVARVAGGSWLKALKQICDADDSKAMLQCFIQLMRLAYVRDLPGLMKWSEGMTTLTREQQKAYLSYMQQMLRENFIYNFGRSELNFMTPQEADFAYKFARFINERNIIRFAEEFAHAQRDVAGNVNGKTIFFNLALQTIILLRV